MNQQTATPRLKTWVLMTALLSATLIYGLMIRANGPVAGHAANHSAGPGSDQGQAFELISDQLPIRPNRPDTASSGASVRREAVLMGSQFVFIVDAPRQQALAAITEAANVIKDLESRLSSWKPGSDIYRLNERAGRQAVRVSATTLELLRLAKDLSRETAGAFDVSVGPLWDLWPFRNPRAPLPSRAQIDQRLHLVDSTTIELDEKAGTAYLPNKGMKVNLGAIGKGYAAELAIEKMQQLGIERAAISAGGDLYLLGRKISGPWVVELEHPRWPGRYIDRFIAGDIAVATSGDAKQYLERGGRRYGHIIDPRSGWPADDCQSVTIVSDSATEADAYATAVYVMGPQQGMAWVEQHPGIEALIVDKQGRTQRSSGWAALTANAPVERPVAAGGDI
jgi:thiamine biosynthesis lipoprotein